MAKQLHQPLHRQHTARTWAVACMVGMALLGNSTSWAAGFSKTPLPTNHPLVGAWRIDVPNTQCYEIYDMRADGTLQVVSGAQQADAEFSLAKKPDGEGFYKWTNKITNHNQQPDCLGTVMQTGHEATFYITFHSTGDQFLLCERADLSACFGPFVRQPAI